MQQAYMLLATTSLAGVWFSLCSTVQEGLQRGFSPLGTLPDPALQFS